MSEASLVDNTFTDLKPIYLQLAQRLYREICRGEIRAGDKLPSVREAAMELGINPNTVQRTYTDLEQEGIIYKKKGRGSFVTTNEEQIQKLRQRLVLEEVQFFLLQMKELGLNDPEILSFLSGELQHNEQMNQT